MPYIYAAARELVGKPKVGDFQCVALVRHFTNAPPTLSWRQGETVLGNKNLLPGTAIATFEHGRWPSLARGNHSALYLGQVSDGIYVVDQWPNNGTDKIEKRFIRLKKRYANGIYETPSDNAAAFSVIR
ncbi:BPSL0067 family protein [Rugamonas sp. CCM 8940]|uniref:BPSL0067 family protein n=1 Tax=Rugamonas sp. CCM 8940 TaxID=2765359 RepID=UPI0018F28F22|nr:BPSL0067 family protein [Rugamonas sp. CCM 8940]MBJ7314365.1 BPSL0067 family protein [Rugamonas sp. CCM 8940]